MDVISPGLRPVPINSTLVLFMLHGNRSRVVTPGF
jgi:hypothetical protein